MLEAGMISVAIGLIITALGYNFKLPGYSRKKLLEGQSANEQRRARYYLGNSFMRTGIIIMSVSAFLIFIVFGLLLTVETVETTPKKVDIMIAQGKTVIIADGRVQEFSGAHYHIRRLYYRQQLNAYGFECPDSTNELIMEDQQDQWEALRR